MYTYRLKTKDEFLTSGWGYDHHYYALEPITNYLTWLPSVYPSMLTQEFSAKDLSEIKQFMLGYLSCLTLYGHNWSKDMFVEDYTYVSEYDTPSSSKAICKCCLYQLMRGDGHDSTCVELVKEKDDETYHYWTI